MKTSSRTLSKLDAASFFTDANYENILVIIYETKFHRKTIRSFNLIPLKHQVGKKVSIRIST